MLTRCECRPQPSLTQVPLAQTRKIHKRGQGAYIRCLRPLTGAQVLNRSITQVCIDIPRRSTCI